MLDAVVLSAASAAAQCTCVQVRQGLKDYKGGASSAQQLIDVVVSVLRQPGRQHLLPGFEQLLSRKQRAWLHTCLGCEQTCTVLVALGRTRPHS